jgi:hypothetical protein
MADEHDCGFTGVRAKEAADKVKQLVQDRYNGDWESAFRHYAGSDNLLSGSEVRSLLDDAGVGTRLTRGVYAAAVVGHLDADQDGKVSADELRSVLDKEYPE